MAQGETDAHGAARPRQESGTALAKLKDVRVAALCEIDDCLVPPVVKSLGAAGQPEPHVEKDVRRLLEDRSIDAIVVAAPNHWHAFASSREPLIVRDARCDRVLSVREPIRVRTVPLATHDEIEFQLWCDEGTAREQT